jgi:hypothetical protein
VVVDGVTFLPVMWGVNDPGGGSSPGSEAPFDAWWDSPEAVGHDYRDLAKRAYSRGAADRDAAVSRAHKRADFVLTEVVAEAVSKAVLPVVQSTLIEALKEFRARLSSTTETPTTTGGEKP